MGHLVFNTTGSKMIGGSGRAVLCVNIGGTWTPVSNVIIRDQFGNVTSNKDTNPTTIDITQLPVGQTFDFRMWDEQDHGFVSNIVTLTIPGLALGEEDGVTAIATEGGISLGIE